MHSTYTCYCWAQILLAFLSCYYNCDQLKRAIFHKNSIPAKNIQLPTKVNIQTPLWTKLIYRTTYNSTLFGKHNRLGEHTLCDCLEGELQWQIFWYCAFFYFTHFLIKLGSPVSFSTVERCHYIVSTLTLQYVSVIYITLHQNGFSSFPICVT